MVMIPLAGGGNGPDDVTAARQRETTALIAHSVSGDVLSLVVHAVEDVLLTALREGGQPAAADALREALDLHRETHRALLLALLGAKAAEGKAQQQQEEEAGGNGSGRH